MNPAPDFLKKDFELHANIWCDHEGRITRHLLKLVDHADNFVSYWKTCEDCYNSYERLKSLGVTKTHPRLPDRVPTAEWVFLVLHPEDVIA